MYRSIEVLSDKGSAYSTLYNAHNKVLKSTTTFYVCNIKAMSYASGLHLQGEVQI